MGPGHPKEVRTTQSCLVAAVLEAPMDEAPRLALADLLEDAGDERHLALRHSRAAKWTAKYIANGRRVWHSTDATSSPRIAYLPYMEMRLTMQKVKDCGGDISNMAVIMVEYACIYGEPR